MRPSRCLIAPALLTACVVGISACGGTSGGQPVDVAVSDLGCSPAVLSLSAGKKEFRVTGGGSGKVTEYEILKGKKIVGEREDLTPGVTSKFTVTLQPGVYQSYCPNAKAQYGKIVVVKAGATGGPTVGDGTNIPN